MKGFGNPFSGTWDDQVGATSPYAAGLCVQNCRTETRRDLGQWFRGLATGLRIEREARERRERGESAS